MKNYTSCDNAILNNHIRQIQRYYEQNNKYMCTIRNLIDTLYTFTVCGESDNESRNARWHLFI